MLPASLMPLFYGQLTSELGNFEHWPFSTVWENSSGYFEQWELLIRDCCMHNISLHSQTDRRTFSMTGMELSHGRAWAGDWLRAEFPKLAKDLSIFIKDQSICADRQMSIQNGLEPFHCAQLGPLRGPGDPRGPFSGFGSPLGLLFCLKVPFFSILG